MFSAADAVAAELPRAVNDDGDILLGGINFNGMPVKLGDLFADLTANRLTGRQDLDNRVVKQYSSLSYAAPRAAWVLTGALYKVGSSYLMTLELVKTSEGSQVRGWEIVLSESDLEGLMTPSSLADAGVWDEFEPNDTMNEARRVEFPFEVSGLQLGESDEDWFAIEVAESASVTFLHAATGGSTDTYLELYSPEDTSWPIIEDDDTDGGNAALEIPLLSPGTWYLKVRAYDPTTTGEYSLSMDITEGELGPGEPNEGADRAEVLNVGTSPVSGRIDYTGDEDWYRITLNRPLGSDEVLRIETLGFGDTLINLLDEYEGSILSDDDSGSDNNAMVMASALDAGTYFVVVSGYGGNLTDYELMANIQVPVRDDYEDDSEMSTASLIEVGERQRRNFSPVGDVDWVEFRIDQEGYYSMGTEGDIDTYMELYNTDGSMIEENDDAEDYNATIIRRLSPGQYYMMVSPYSSVSPDEVYTLYLENDE